MRAEVVDLKPSTWYYFRIYIEYAGKRVYSPVKAASTGKAPPEIPRNLKVRSEKKNKLYTSLRTARHVIRVAWSEPKNNGSDIERYLLQQMKIYIDDSSPGKPQWENIYNNFHREAILEGPGEDVLEIMFRVKAKNPEGWSDFGKEIRVNRNSHPSLFPTRPKSAGLDQLNRADDIAASLSSTKIRSTDDKDIYDIYQAMISASSSKSPGSKKSPKKVIDPAVAAAVSSPTQKDILFAFCRKVDDEISRFFNNHDYYIEFVSQEFTLISNQNRIKSTH